MRKNLFRDIIFIVLLTIISIASLAIYRGASIKDQVSTQLITNSSRLIQKRFTIFLAPFESSLEVLARSSAVKELSGDLSSIKKLETIFSPYLDVYDNLGEITLITSSGDITSIVRSRDGYTSLVIQGSGSLDPSQPDSTLFRGSVASPDDKPVFWHESFSASNDKSGVSAGISVVQEDGEILVIAFTIPGSKILQFIADIEMVEGADIILFNSKGLFISRQQLSRAVKSKPLQTIHHPAPPEDMILKAIESWVLKGSNENEVERFTIEGMKWWAGFSHLGSGSGDGSICVLVPESGIMEDVHGHLLNLAVPIGLIVIFALIMSFNLVRRYSFQLKDLPHQHVIDTEFTESIKRIIHLGESSTVEFKSSVRKNIKADRFGKEIELAWLKTATAFMNSDGGILLIGVDDNGVATGLEHDEFSSEDKCRLHVKNLINNHIGTAFSRYIHLKFCRIENQTVLVVECERVRQPVFLFVGKSEEFYVRSGPMSMKLNMSSMVTYLSER